MKKLLLFLFCGLISFASMAQDFHLTQFHMSPLTLNPASTGLFNGNWRLTGNYRNQWQSVLPTVPYRTYSGSVDLSLRSGDFNRLGIGLCFFNDKAGTSQLTTSNVSLSLSYNMALSRNKDYYLATGLQVALNQKSINYNSLTFGNQYVNSGFDPLYNTGENFTTDHYSFSDASAGVLWYHLRGRTNQYAGASVFHINRSNLAFINNDQDKLYTKIVGHGGVQFPIGGKADLLPMILVMKQGPSFELVTGALVKFILDQNKNTGFGGTAFYIGPYYRMAGDNYHQVNNDAIILDTKLDVGNITFGLSYDINISGLILGSTGRGGPELAVQYVGDWGGHKHKIYCPKF